MTRLALSDRLFALSSFVRLLPGRIENACNRAGIAIARLGSFVRGCGCTNCNPEMCSAPGTLWGWCECECHDCHITTRPSAEVN